VRTEGFEVKTVEQVMKKLEKAVHELRAVCDENDRSATFQDALARDATNKSAHHRTEAYRAEVLADKLEELIR
jgi:hypothetical protein